MYYSFGQLLEVSATSLLSRWELLRYDTQRCASGALIHNVLNLLSAARIAAELGDSKSFERYVGKIRKMLKPIRRHD